MALFALWGVLLEWSFCPYRIFSNVILFSVLCESYIIYYFLSPTRKPHFLTSIVSLVRPWTTCQICVNQVYKVWDWGCLKHFVTVYYCYKNYYWPCISVQLINLIFVLCSTVRAHLSFSLVTRTHIQNSSFEMVQLQVLINSWHICLVCVVECNLLKCYYSQGGSSSYLECCGDFLLETFVRAYVAPLTSPTFFPFNSLINLCFYLLQTSWGKILC